MSMQDMSSFPHVKTEYGAWPLTQPRGLSWARVETLVLCHCHTWKPCPGPVTTPARTWKVPVSFLGSNLVLEALSMSGHEQFPPREDGVRRVAPDPASWAFAGPRGDTCTLSLSHMEAMSCSCYNACKDMEDPRNETGTFHVLAGVVTG